MYLDTLKVSTLEQTAEQTSARGGQGNPELIAWDYGKEISLSLEDALYTPASQSLMWGGKFGIKKPKVQGLWNPLVYPKDEYGRIQYLKKDVYEIEITPGSDPRTGTITVDEVVYNLTEVDGVWTFDDEAPVGVIQIICPCDGTAKFVRFSPNEGNYKYTDISDWSVGYKCPKGYDTGERENATTQRGQLVSTYYWNIGDDSIYNRLKRTSGATRSERAEIVIDNYNQFDFSAYDMSLLWGKREEGSKEITQLNDDSQAGTKTRYCIYTPIEKCDAILGDGTTSCGSTVAAYGYEWKNVDMKMTSLEGDQDIYYLENANLRYRVPQHSTQKEIMIARQGFYETEYDEDETPQWIKVENAEEITDIIELTRQNTSDQSYGYFVNPYDSTIDFYMNITLNLAAGNSSIERKVRVPLGRFYIIADWNFGGETPYDLTNPINSGIENVHVLDRMEKCKAVQTFAIDTNKNLAMANYRYMQEYAEAPLTVFIDPRTMKPYEPNAQSFVRQNGDVVNGNLRIVKQYEIYYKWTRTVAPEYTTLGHQIIVDAKHFPGAYRIVGETYARARADGKDQRYQFEIPLAKLSAETNLTLQADGDPTTFTMNFKVLRRNDGVMMKLTQYNVECNKYDGYESGSTKVVPMDTIEDNTKDIIYEDLKTANLVLLSPKTLNVPISGNETGGTDSFNINAGLQVNTRVGTTVYNTSTLDTISQETNEKTEIQPLDGNDYDVEIKNLDEEVGE